MNTSEPMIIGIPPDMRRTTIVSVLGHLFLLLVLTAVPLMRLPARDAGSYQVVLISPSSVRRPAHPPEKAPVPTPKVPASAASPPVQKQALTAVKQEIPAPPMEKVSARVPLEAVPAARIPVISPARPVPAKPSRMTDLLRSKEIALPQEVAPASDSSPPQPARIQVPKQEVPAKPPVDNSLFETLKNAEDRLNAPVAQAPPVPSTAVASSKPSRTAEEVTRQLNQLALPKTLKPVAPSLKATERETQPPQRSLQEEVTRMFAKAPPAPSQESPVSKAEPVRQIAAVNPTAGTTMAATLERCPPKAKRYCPLLEAAINRLWNADYNPDVRRVLESAGDSATLILIEIRPDGLIQNIAVQESSGNKSYDLAIQSLLRDQKQFPPLPEELKNENFKAITSFKYTRKT
jgi:TonB-like protein